MKSSMYCSYFLFLDIGSNPNTRISLIIGNFTVPYFSTAYLYYMIPLRQSKSFQFTIASTYAPNVYSSSDSSIFYILTVAIKSSLFSFFPIMIAFPSLSFPYILQFHFSFYNNSFVIIKSLSSYSNSYCLYIFTVSIISPSYILTLLELALTIVNRFFIVTLGFWNIVSAPKSSYFVFTPSCILLYDSIYFLY